jgi:hypothetical protein
MVEQLWTAIEAACLEQAIGKIKKTLLGLHLQSLLS